MNKIFLIPDPPEGGDPSRTSDDEINPPTPAPKPPARRSAEHEPAKKIKDLEMTIAQKDDEIFGLKKTLKELENALDPSKKPKPGKSFMDEIFEFFEGKD